MTLRQDIQVLRGLAVLLVLVFHAQITPIRAGYLGVDVFFVISGFLITSIIARKELEDRFSLGQFYLKRAKRLLPISYVIYIATAIASIFLLADVEYDRFQDTLFGAVTFIANIDLWQNSNYFSPSAKLNPLTHTWSLAIEEQYYLLMPLTLLLTPRRLWLPGAALVLVMSLILCIYLSPRSPAASFYLLPTRAWQLALGSVCALATLKRDYTQVHKKPMAIFCLFILVLVPWWAPFQTFRLPVLSIHPGGDAILVCIATAYLLVNRFAWLETGPVMSYFAKVGDFSYSLYLVHWPLFAFAANAYLGETPPLLLRIGLLGLSFVLSYILYVAVENPMRYRTFSGLRAAVIAVIASVFVVGASYGFQHLRGFDPEPNARQANKGLGASCDYKSEYVPKEKCQTSDTATTLIWGDSFAMHIVPGLADTAPNGVIQATRSSCGPIVGLAPFRPKYSLYEDWAMGCAKFNRSVIRHISNSPDISHIVLGSPFQYYLNEGAHGIAVAADLTPSSADFTPQRVEDALIDTVLELQALGKSVSIVGPTPTSGYNVGMCLARERVGAISFGPNKTCQIMRSDVDDLRGPVVDMLQNVEAKTGAIIVNLADVMCDGETCPSKNGEIGLYLDTSHFSRAGSRIVAERYNLVTRLGLEAPK